MTKYKVWTGGHLTLIPVLVVVTVFGLIGLFAGMPLGMRLICLGSCIGAWVYAAYRTAQLYGIRRSIVGDTPCGLHVQPVGVMATREKVFLVALTEQGAQDAIREWSKAIGAAQAATNGDFHGDQQVVQFVDGDPAGPWVGHTLPLGVYVHPQGMTVKFAPNDSMEDVKERVRYGVLLKMCSRRYGMALEQEHRVTLQKLGIAIP